MSVNRKSGGAWKETRHDRWYTLAKEQGYRSRAAFKLIQLNKKYNFLQSTRSCLDLGAAPGGWLQVCQKYMPVSSMLIGVDIVPIRKMRGVITIQADITTPECKTAIKKELQGWDVDLVLHDGAPNVSGGQVWSRDAYEQNELVISALRLASVFLRPDGNFITKVFRSQDYNNLLWVLQQLFHNVDVTKPMASRAASAEIFIVCRHYKAPKKIDPFLLDPHHIFQQFETIKTTNQIFSKQKVGRSRSGYDDIETAKGLIGKNVEAMEFINSEDPIITLGSYHSIIFNSSASISLLSHSSTNQEIRSLCEDLKVLGKGDFKALLRWRKKIRMWIKELAEEDEKMKAEQEAKPIPPALTDEELANIEETEMSSAIAEFHVKQQHRKKVERKKRHEMKQKQSRRLLLNKNNLIESQEMIAPDHNDELFTLSAIRDQQVMERLEQEEIAPDTDEDEMTKHHEDDNAAHSSESDDETSYYKRLEQDLDHLYEQYKERRKILDKKKAPTEDSIQGELKAQIEADTDSHDAVHEAISSESSSGSEEEDYEDLRAGLKRKRTQRTTDGNSDTDSNANPLLVSMSDDKDKMMNSTMRMQRWFQRGVFADTENGELASNIIASEDNDKQHMKGIRDTNKPRFTLVDMMNQLGNKDSETDDDSDDVIDEDESDHDTRGRWLGEEDVDNHQDDNRSSSVSDRSAHRLVGIDSLSKSRERLDEETKEEEKKEKIREKHRRKMERRRERATERETQQQGDVKADNEIDNDDDDNDVSSHMLVDQDSAKKAKKMKKREDKKRGLLSTPSTSGDTLEGFEEVPVVYSDDDQSIATTLALGQHLLIKKQREELLNSSYNRYSVDLKEETLLPQWFTHEERLHNTANLPVTKAEVEAYKDRLKMINAKPIKKIAEARMRNKLKTERKWEKIKQKLQNIDTDDNTSSNAEKMRLMERLVSKKDKRKEKGDRRYIISKKGGGSVEVKGKSSRGKGRVVQVDKRLKKDKRGTDRAEKRGVKRKKTANKRRRKV